MGKGLEEREINLWDMFWAVCLKWRSILSCAIIFAILAGGLSYVKSAKDAEMVFESAQKDFGSAGKDDVDAYLKYAELYERQKIYNQNSTLMNLNSTGFYVGTLTYYVDNFYLDKENDNQGNNIIAIISSYKAVLDSDEFLESAADVMGIEVGKEYARESFIFDDQRLDMGETESNSDEEDGVLAISIYATEEEVCEKLLSLVKASMESNKEKALQMFGKHDTLLVNEEISFAISNFVIEYQRDNIDQLRNYKAAMETLQNKFSQTQAIYVQYSLENEEEAEIEIETVLREQYKIGFDIKMIILGFLGGTFLMFVIWTIVYVFGGKVRYEDDFEAVAKTKMLGSIDSEIKKRWFAFIDCLIVKIRYYNRPQFKKEEALDLIAANIRIEMKKTGSKQVVCTGASLGEEEKAIIELIGKRLEKDNIELICESSVLYNAKSLEELVEVGCAILIEKAEKSLYQEVLKEIAICEQQNVNLIGYIILE